MGLPGICQLPPHTRGLLPDYHLEVTPAEPGSLPPRLLFPWGQMSFSAARGHRPRIGRRGGVGGRVGLRALPPRFCCLFNQPIFAVSRFYLPPYRSLPACQQLSECWSLPVSHSGSNLGSTPKTQSRGIPFPSTGLPPLFLQGLSSLVSERTLETHNNLFICQARGGVPDTVLGPRTQKGAAQGLEEQRPLHPASPGAGKTSSICSQ